MQKVLIAATAASVTLAGLSGCGNAKNSGSGATAEPQALVVVGSLLFTDFSAMSTGPNPMFRDVGAECHGTGGYGDITEGAQLTIRDASGKAVALGELQKGHTVARGQVVAGCEFQFAVANVPASSSIYSIEVNHRGPVQFTKDKAQHVQITLG